MWLGLPHKMVTSKWVVRFLTPQLGAPDASLLGNEAVAASASLLPFTSTVIYQLKWPQAHPGVGFLFFNIYLFGYAGS